MDENQEYKICLECGTMYKPADRSGDMLPQWFSKFFRQSRYCSYECKRKANNRVFYHKHKKEMQERSRKYQAEKRRKS